MIFQSVISSVQSTNVHHSEVGKGKERRVAAYQLREDQAMV